MKTFKIAVLPGDGIGSEVTPICVEMLQSVANKCGEFNFELDTFDAGAACFARCGEALPGETAAAARQADAILLGAMGLPEVRYADGTEIAPQLDLRFMLELYAGVRPVKPIPGLPLPLLNPSKNPIDFVLVRESTEGLFASHGKGTVVDDSEATDTMKITRAVSEKLFDFSFRLARQRKAKGFEGRLTCVDKANVFASMAFFRKIFDEAAVRHHDLDSDHMYVDAAALNMVKQPWNMDVLVTENMFGDILSDLGAGLMGGMGMAPSADIGDDHAVFQPCHGSAPDIAGQGKANPTAMLLSGAMMLEWLGERHNLPSMTSASESITTAVERVFADGNLVPIELGGDVGTGEIFDRVMHALDS
ncbi:MAG: isocitrate/isopropylmalate family dehydrogenase [Pseudomonadota bacterium]